MSPQPKPPASNWYDTLPMWARMFVQLGFAGLVGALFAFQVYSAETRATADREMFREELRAQRQELQAAVREMRRAVDRIERGDQ